MKKFIKRLFLFLAIIIGFILFDVCLQKTLLFRDENMKLAKNINTLILGHSHVALGYNTQFINNTVNIGEQAELYVYSYFKLKKIVQNNPKIERVFVEYTNNQINKKDMDRWLWEDKYLQHSLKKYGVLLDGDALMLIYKNNTQGFITAFSKSLFDNIPRLYSLNKNKFLKGQFGGYLPCNEQLKDNQEIRKRTLKDTKISFENIIYLKQIVKYCKQIGIEIILVRSPMHKSYDLSYNETEYQMILKTYFKNVKFIDNKDLPIPDDGFQDREHLNSRGAKIYSKYFNKQINENH